MAQTIDPIDSTITFYAEILSSGILKSLDKEGNDVTDKDELVALLKNPNEFQNFKEFIKEWLYYHYSHGWNYVVPQSSAVGFEKRLGSGSTTTKIYNCDPDHIEWNTSFMGYLLNFIGVIRERKIAFNYKPLGFNAVNYSDVIPFIDVRQNPEKPWMGISRLLALRQQIQNFSLALQGKENLIKRTGAILVSLDKSNEDLGLDTPTGTGKFDKDGSPMLSTHKENLENQIRSTGLGNNSMGVMFSTLALKSQPLSSGITVDFDKISIEDARQIFNKYNVPKEFQNLTAESAKFMNRQMAMIEVIQNTIEPLSTSFCDKMRSYFNWENTITLDFTHLPVFSDNEQVRAETQQAISNLYIGLRDAKVIDDKKLIQILTDNGIIT